MGVETEEKQDDETKKDIFKGVTYYVVGNISDKVTALLEQNGAKRDSYLSEMVSHVIADSTTPDDYSEAKELFELPIVTSDWATLSHQCGKLLPKEVFALEGRLFSGVVACPMELETEDILSVWCMVIYHGGKCQLQLDDKVTHLITAGTTGAKYTTALEHTEQIKIVTPDWVVETITKGEIQDEAVYHPSLVEYSQPEPPSIPSEQEEDVVEGTGVISTNLEAMDISINNGQHFSFQGIGGPGKQPSFDERMELSRLDTSSAKEALARKITSRIHGKAPSDPSTPDVPLISSNHPVGSPGSTNGMRIASPIPAIGLQPRLDTPNIRNTLRNITNRATTPVSVPLRTPLPSGAAKMNQMMGIGLPSQPRPPPPDYPFPTRTASLTPTQAAGPVANPPSQQPSSTPSSAQSGPQYFGHDVKENVPPDLCLLGCVFCIVDYQSILGVEEIASWKKVIEQFGGQAESSYCNRVTHVLCAKQKSDVFKMALKEGKRVVSAFWLNDCLMQKKMVPPWQALHLPLSFNSEKPGFNQMISVTNFDGEERVRLKQMINAIGAKYTGYMTHHNSALICKKPGGMKFEKAKEWRIAVVNVQWLSDLVLGNMDALRLPVHVRYLQVGQGREFHMDLTRVAHLMGGWKMPIKISKDTWKKFGPGSLSATGQENSHLLGQTPAKRLKVDCSTPAPESEPSVPKVLFTLYPKSEVNRLGQIVKQLGGIVVTNPRHCSHLVCPSLARTIKFFIAISSARFVVTTEWLDESSSQGSFQDESIYRLKDEKGEFTLGCELAESLRRAQSRPLFQGLTFYLTPGVVPPVCEMVSIIENAGGTVMKKRPSAKYIAAYVDDNGGPRFIVITCLGDLHLSQDLLTKKIPIFNSELVLTGIMRQELDFNSFRIYGNQL